MKISETMLKQLKDYIKFDGEDETLVVSLYLAAIEKAEGETGKSFIIERGIAKSELYWLAIQMTVEHWYDNRGIASDKAMQGIPISAGHVFNLIAMSSEFEKKVTE